MTGRMNPVLRLSSKSKIYRRKLKMNTRRDLSNMELVHQQQILHKNLVIQQQRISELEHEKVTLLRYKRSYEQNIDVLKEECDEKQCRIDELEQWTHHLQSRIDQLEKWIRYPWLGLLHILRKQIRRFFEYIKAVT